jgi:multiple sugar transport system permease protein
MGVAGVVSTRRRLSGARREELFWGVLFALPWMIGFVWFKAGPILASLYLSFHHYDMLTPIRFAGTENYVRLANDPLFATTLYNTAYITAIGVPIHVGAAFAIALLLNSGVRGMGLYRTWFYMPTVTPLVASSLLWLWFLNPTVGPINSALELAGLPGPNWLQSEFWSKPSVILVQTWAVGTGMVVFLAGLQGVPRHLYEAAEIDGAGWWAQLGHITLPMMSPTIFFVTITNVISHMQVFTEAYVMTKGGPVNTTLFYVYYLFNNGFAYFRMGYAAALAWILLLIILALTYVQLVLAPRWVHYEEEPD